MDNWRHYRIRRHCVIFRFCMKLSCELRKSFVSVGKMMNIVRGYKVEQGTNGGMCNFFIHTSRAHHEISTVKSLSIGRIKLIY
jgi:hypothetical protein